ncbi:MAG: pectate lyase [Muribaculaceae bacterium]|nr:pectate lyase [Muribaculaceae bacterium]
MKSYLLPLAALLMASSAAAQATDEQLPAFPGAEGYARYITGGRGGKVYHVTRLDDDSKEGSLRWALSQASPSTIVFDVSGTIHLKSQLNISKSNTTIAGQTAPGDGICVADYPVAIKGNNVIVRYMRFRLGNANVTVNGADGWDAFGAMDKSNLMIDHCSVSWSIDECCSILGNKNTTLQWSIISQSLVNAGHSKGNHGYGGNWGGSGASFHHNLMVHHTSRTPRFGPRQSTQKDERMDYRNNVIYNYGGNGCYGAEGMNANLVNNYYKPGPGTPSGTKGKRILKIDIRTEDYVSRYPAFAPMLHVWGKFYADGNVNSLYDDVTADNWANGIYNQIDKNSCDKTWSDETADSIRLSRPIDFIYTTTHSAEDAYSLVLDYAGASLHRDSHDALMVSDTREGVASYTGKNLGKGFINTQDDNRPADAADDWSAWPLLETTEAPVDTDRDGMPDAWETENGFDPADPEDRNTVMPDGYTALEHYINGLVEEITIAQNAGGVPDGIDTAGIDDVIAIPADAYTDDTWYTIQGMALPHRPAAPGIYIHHRKKVIIR